MIGWHVFKVLEKKIQRNTCVPMPEGVLILFHSIEERSEDGKIGRWKDRTEGENIARRSGGERVP